MQRSGVQLLSFGRYKLAIGLNMPVTVTQHDACSKFWLLNVTCQLLACMAFLGLPCNTASQYERRRLACQVALTIDISNADCNAELRSDALLCRKHFSSLGVIRERHARSAPLSAGAKRTWARQIARPQSAYSLLVSTETDLRHSCIRLLLLLLLLYLVLLDIGIQYQ